MIGIREIGIFIPQDKLSNRDRMAEFAIDDAFLEGKIGVESVTRMVPGDDTLDLCIAAVGALENGSDPAWLQTLEACIVCTQNPQGSGLPHTSALVHGALELAANTICFDISLGCSGFVQSLSVLSALMEAQGLNRALLITADPYSKIIDPKDRDTAMLFGDGAAACVLERCESGSGLLSMFACRIESQGHRADALAVRNGRLHMDGRTVFNFAAVAAPKEIKALAEDCDISLDTIDRFALHQGSRYIVDTIRKRLGVPGDRVPLRMRDHGNTVSSTIPLLLVPMLNDNDIQTVVVCGFGVGLSVATGLLQRC